jgi:small subunit ribosomal protein S4
MGSPKKQRSKVQRPARPFDAMRLEYEAQLMKTFGLRRKREIWAAQALLRNFRQRARTLLGRSNQKLQEELIAKLNRLGITVNNLEDVLGIKVEDILSRRLQSVLHSKGLVPTIRAARQAIVHGHVKIKGRKITQPGYLVRAEEENDIEVNKWQKGLESHI